MSVQAVPSTPSKTVATSQTYRRESKDKELERDLNASKHEGIGFEDMVKILFQVDEKEFLKMKAEYSGWNIEKRVEFSTAKLELQKVLSVENKMYPQFVKMGNEVIQRAFQVRGTHVNKIKLLSCHDNSIKDGFGDRKPDIVLVPEEDAGDTVVAAAKSKSSRGKRSEPTQEAIAILSWAHVLLSIEVKRGSTKHSLEEDSELDQEQDGRASKMPRSSTARSQEKRRVSSKTAGGIESTTSARSADSASIDSQIYEVQLASYAAEMQSRNGDRIFSLGLCVRGSKARLYYFHHSVTVVSAEVDFLTDFTPLAMLLILYVRKQVGINGFGFNPHTGYTNPFNTKDSKTRELIKLTPVLEKGSSFQLKSNDKIQKGARIHTVYSLVGRGTAVHEAKLLDENGTGTVPELVLKTSWQVKTRTSEHKFIEEARKIDRDHIVEVFGWKNIPDIPQTKQLVEKCTNKPKEAYEEKELRILLEMKYKPIYEITEPEKFWLAFIQCVKCAHRLYSKGHILHRDLSITNLGYYTDGNGKVVGVLIDFDLASMGTSEVHKSRSRSGTAPFMAREVLDTRKPYTHKFYHELESLFYVLIWHTLGYSTSHEKYPSNTLDGWRKGSWESILDAKDLFIKGKWEDIFPVTDPNTDFLRHQCRGLCAGYSAAAFSSGLDLSLDVLSTHWSKDRSAPPAKMKRAVTYRKWLDIVRENDAEPCNKDCCVELA